MMFGVPHIVVEFTGDRNINWHLEGYLNQLVQEHVSIALTILISKGLEPDGLVRSLRSGYGGNCSIECSRDNNVPEGAQLYCPAIDGCPSRIRQALLNGVKVLQNCATPNVTEDCRDFLQGYINNDGAEWYARIFPEPTYVGELRKIVLGLGVTINPRSIILNKGIDGVGGLVQIGRATHIGADALLNLGPTDFVVGKFSMISANFSAHGMRHSLTHVSNFAISKGPFAFFGSRFEFAKSITIGNDVWIGEGVTCLPGVEIPDGCVVGAGSVVTKALEPYAVYVGNPTRLLRYRFEAEKIELLRKIAWWDFDYDHLHKIQHAFKCKVTDLAIDDLGRMFSSTQEKA